MQFVCRIGTPDGRVLEESHTAADERALRSELDKRGYHIFEIRRKGVPRNAALSGAARGMVRRRRIKAEEFLVFNQELAALLRAGLPLLQTLDLMLERLPNPGFKAVMVEIRDQVKSGADLSEAFAAHGEMFPRLYPSSLKAGERSGELELVIRRFIRYMKLVLEARKKVISALVYPAVLVCLSITMIAIMAIFVVPKFQIFFNDLQVDLPLLTRITLGFSKFASARPFLLWNWAWGLVGLAFLAAFLRRMAKTPEGAITLDGWKIRLPLLGPVLHRFALSEFSRSLSTLLAGGIPLVPAFEIAVSSVGNAHVRAKLEPTIQLVREGKPFYVALEESGMFVDMSIDMIKVGEATGALDEMLSNVSDLLDEQVETRMGRLLALVEPMMLVFMGLIIGLLLVSIYLPMFSMLGSAKF
ncbi:MAG TPA: type II secretion system F family protein [Thermoanaerobaculia bacterium]|jgi:type IV pilus assembly protein PilC|nr:type II secretion system F family protein [Thermoanaerobaculia bacterium]